MNNRFVSAVLIMLGFLSCVTNPVKVEKVTLPPAATEYLQGVCETNGLETYDVYFMKSDKRPPTFYIELITLNKLAAHLDRNFEQRREIAKAVFKQLDWEKQLETHAVIVMFTEDDGRFFFNHEHSTSSQFYVSEGRIMDGF